MAYMNNNIKDGGDSGYPKGEPVFQMEKSRHLYTWDHFVRNVNDKNDYEYVHNNNDPDFFINDHNRHNTRDVNVAGQENLPTSFVNNDGVVEPVFSGSTTNVNPLNDREKEKVINNGLEASETESVRDKSGDDTKVPPLSPLHPFFRMNPTTARVANITTYNRTKLPIADLEFRKGFRHIFFTRPECYIMSHNPNGLNPVLSRQCENDEDFASSFSRMPHILNMLSPIYVTGSYSQNGINSNWNYLLSNRVTSMSGNITTNLTYDESGTKSTSGFSIMTGSASETRQGSTIGIKFRDTKSLEVYELLRMQMLYIAKCRKGIFAPSYNGYQYENGFISAADGGTPVGNSLIYHPYDCAIDYTSSIFDIITNESMTKILYWCKYYGVYPTEATLDGVNSENSNAITNEIGVSTTFKYHYKLENVNKSLVEFNYNAGITDDLGRINKSQLNTSFPFLLKDDPNDAVMPQYIGASGMFTGSPYIIIGESDKDPLNCDNKIITPYLQFMNVDNVGLNNNINMGIDNVHTETTDNALGIIK